ncbi:ABC transporter ATP-binding protein [Hoyosella rhizosphaerae]|uniref:ABC-type quaternary amine transporter n=1 Tax=Hoyosella rhizosphaerae TaxID=1755582 RepID=A0A916U7R1_9ACTN|nr:ABC transporter ATP-binding protein [Hoyosella rhizosphaerae]MBN4927643.1 ABC transporter ATP-binding protein [Hoyosella rhizosphaerae]GGC62833.1 ABC transporter ATP-binding protein [Hoyosella rhizosphaerae]
MSTTLELRDVTKTYADTVVIDAINLTVNAGECVAILGPSGVGKSTILRLIAGLDEPTAGSVRLGETTIDTQPAEERGVGLMFQQPLLFPHLDAIDNVAFSARAAGKSRRQAREHAQKYLDLVQLGGYAHRRSTELSGGQAQRVALARALAAQPRVLLLDEPFSALDPQLRAEMHSLLRTIRRELNPTVLLVTHDQHEASVLADRIAILLDSRLAQVAAPHEIYSRPASLEVHRMMGGLNVIPGDHDGTYHHSSMGRLEVPTCEENTPSTLVFRHESVTVTPPPGDVTAQITEITHIGARQRLTLRANNTTLHADTPPTTSVAVGDTVGLHIPLDARHTIRTTP